MDSTGQVIADGLKEDDYHSYIGEAVEPWSYLKFPYYKPLGYPAGMYRVGPLARLNVCSHIGTPWADKELAEMRQRCGAIANSSFAYHQARLVEIVACLEGIEALLNDPETHSPGFGPGPISINWRRWAWVKPPGHPVSPLPGGCQWPD